MAYIQGESRSQTSLFPVSLEELIPEDHLVRVIDLYVTKLDLGQLGFEKAQPKATGRPAYDPADQLKLYLYGYFQRIRSSRRLEAECQRNIEVMWLINRLKPDFKTIADFRKNNKGAFVTTCRAFVQFCRSVGLIAGDLVAIDDGLKSLFQHKNKRPEQVGAFGLRPVSVFSHSLLRASFFVLGFYILPSNSKTNSTTNTTPIMPEGP